MTITAETAEAAASGPCCDYCGLPISGAASSPAPDTAPDYCCFGCRFASQVTQERGEEGAARWALTRLGLAVFFTMNVVMVSMALWSKDWYDAGDTALSATFESLLRWAALAAASPVLLLLGSSLAENAWEQMRRGRFSTDLLLLSGVLASFAYSAVSVVRGDGPIYFEVGCVVLVMVTLGRWFEATGRIKASAALDELAKLLPETVRRIDGAVETVVPLHSVRCGDRLKVLAGERFPTDGLLFETRALVDQQILTGESWPMPKSPGDAILGGSLNLDGTAYFCVSADGSQGTLARLIGLVREARLTRGRLQRLADRVTTVLFPVIALVAAGSVLWHWRASGLENGLLAGLAVTLIACPCALGLATPLAVWNALGIAARRQVLFRNGEVLERLAGVRTVCFDKTGTLTTGTPILEKLTIDPETPWTIFEREAAEIGSGSTHVFSLAIVSFLGEKSRGLPTSERAVQIVAGMGLRRISESRGEVRLGSRRFLEEAGHELPSELLEELNRAESSGSPVSLLGWDGRVRGVFQFAEQLRPEASAAIRQLQELGCNVQVLTGDHEQSARRISTRLGVSIEASLLPEDKLRSLRRTRQNGGVAMVGDGVNDAPALAASDVGIAMGCGADVSRDSAGVCLLGNDLERIPWAIGLARSTVRTIQTNLFWAFFWNLIGVAFAAAGFLNPTLAAFAMIVSSILVISNSLRTNVIDERELHSDREPSTSVRFGEFNPFEFAGNDAPADRVFARNGDNPKEIVETVLAVPNSKRNPVAEEALS